MPGFANFSPLPISPEKAAATVAERLAALPSPESEFGRRAVQDLISQVDPSLTVGQPVVERRLSAILFVLEASRYSTADVAAAADLINSGRIRVPDTENGVNPMISDGLDSPYQDARRFISGLQGTIFIEPVVDLVCGQLTPDVALNFDQRVNLVAKYMFMRSLAQTIPPDSIACMINEFGAVQGSHQ